MATCTVLKADGNRLDHAALQTIAETVANGGVIAYPTDTFYALGADPTNAEGVERVYVIKGREKRKPLLCVISELEAVMRLAAEIPPAFYKLSERFWPGPLTIVFKAAPAIPRSILGPNGTIGLRLPNSEIARRVAAVCGSYITATSANRSGMMPPVSGEQVKRDMGDVIDLLVDAGAVGEGKISTILDLSSGPPKLVREGIVKKEDIESLLKAKV